MRSSLLAALVVVVIALVAVPVSYAQGERVPDPFGRDAQAPLPKSLQEPKEPSVGKAVASPYAVPAKPRASAAKAEAQNAAPEPAAKPAKKPEPAARAAQEPEPPGGEPQPGAPDQPDEPVEPEEPIVPVEPGAGGTGGGMLPRTGLEALWLTLGGIGFLILGWRLHLVARVREVIRRLRTPKEALRAELEDLLEAGAKQERVYAANAEPPVEPATPVARRGGTVG